MFVILYLQMVRRLLENAQLSMSSWSSSVVSPRVDVKLI